MRTLIAQGYGIPRVRDPEAALTRARRAVTLSGEDLRTIGVAISAADTAIRGLRSDGTPALSQTVANVRSMRELGEELLFVIGPRGEVLDTASPELARLRRVAAAASDAARARCQQLTRSATIAKALQDALVTVRDDRYVIPVKAEAASSVPGIVHDTSASGQTLFVEPMAVIELNNIVRTTRGDEHREVERILTVLTSKVARNESAIRHLVTLLTTIDLAFARARLADEMHAIAPRLLDEPAVVLIDARHPLLDDRAVAQSLRLDREHRLIIISGPNMGGKTVALKLAGLAVLMTACGLHLPAGDGTAIGVFSHVRSDIGDAQSIAMSTSTFAAHLRRLRHMVDLADGGLLYLVDEIAGGTEPAAGAALATAVLDRLLSRDALGIVTTHAQELKIFAQSTDGVDNAGMRFALGSHAPTYELDIGVPGRSLAFDLAAREGFDAALLDAARGRVAAEEHAYDRALGELSAARAELSVERTAVLRAREALARSQRELDASGAAFIREREGFLEQADARLGKALREFVAELDRRSRDGASRARVTRSQSELLSRTLDEMHRDLKLEVAPTEQAPQTALRIGARVRINTLGSEGTIVEDLGRDLVIEVGSMRTIAAKRDVTPAGLGGASGNGKRRFERRPARPFGPAVEAEEENGELERVSSLATEIDVRGKRLHESQELVERWLDAAVLVGFSPVRIIHGKGTGALGAGLQEALRLHPSVERLRYGHENEGGSGVTIIHLK